mgnify:FL=1
MTKLTASIAQRDPEASYRITLLPDEVDITVYPPNHKGALIKRHYIKHNIPKWVTSAIHTLDAAGMGVEIPQFGTKLHEAYWLSPQVGDDPDIVDIVEAQKRRYSIS